ncbi:MAG: hypothetical protein ACMXYD_02525 [Candidatus Woesearchaeota archaeon]
MVESSVKVLAYQKSPLVLVAYSSGSIPSAFLTSLSSSEKGFLASVCDASLQEVVSSLLVTVGAAGVSSSVSSRLVSSLSEPVVVSERVGGVFLPLAADPATKQWLVDDVAGSFREDIRLVIEKTRARFGFAQLVVFFVLDRFVNGRLVSDEIVVFGEQILEDASIGYELPFSEEVLSSLCDSWSVVGIHPKFFSSPSLCEELVSRLSSLRVLTPV